MKKIKVEQEVTVVTGPEMADVLGLEPRRFQQLVREGWIEGKFGHNEYDFLRCTHTYLSYCQLQGRH